MRLREASGKSDADAIPTQPLLLVCALCVAFGAYLRVQELRFPPSLTFDEHHFVENARNYLAGRADWNDHPPLGKLLIAAAMLALGDNPAGWRVASLCCGLASIALAYYAGRALFRDTLAGALSAAFVAADGFLLSYSRTALLDGMLVSLGLAALLVLAPRPASRLRLVAVGVIAGLAMSIKLSGVAIALPIALAVALSDDDHPLAKLALLGASGIAALLVYYAQYAIGLTLTGLASSPIDVANASLAIVKHHAALTQMTNPMTSYWYTWFLPLRPIVLRFDMSDGFSVRAMTTLGNPLLWWSSAAVMLWTLGRLGWLGFRGLRSRVAAGRVSPSFGKQSRPALLLGTFWLGFLAPWVLSSRDSYIYHYLPSYAFGLVMLAGAAARCFRVWPRASLIAVLLVAEVSVYYAPVWAQLPLTEEAYAWRLFLPAWR